MSFPVAPRPSLKPWVGVIEILAHPASIADEVSTPKSAPMISMLAWLVDTL